MRIKTYLLALLVLFICMDSYSQIKWKNVTGNQAVAQFGGEAAYITSMTAYRQIWTAEGAAYTAPEWRARENDTLAEWDRVCTFVTATQVLKIPSDTDFLSFNVRSGTSTITTVTTPQTSGKINLCSFSIGLFPTLQDVLAISDPDVSLAAERATGSILATGTIPTIFDFMTFGSVFQSTNAMLSGDWIGRASPVSMDPVYKDIDNYGSYIVPAYGMDHVVIQARQSLPQVADADVYTYEANAFQKMPTVAITISVQFKQDK